MPNDRLESVIEYANSRGLFEPDEVHQATGIVMAQLGVSPRKALTRLRHYAAHRELPLVEISRAVIAGELRFYV